MTPQIIAVPGFPLVGLPASLTPDARKLCRDAEIWHAWPGVHNTPKNE